MVLHPSRWRSQSISSVGLLLSVLLGLMLSVGVPWPGGAVSVDDVPNPRQTYGGWISDSVDWLTPPHEAQLNDFLTTLEAETTIEMAVVTVANTQPSATPKDFTTTLFNQWGIGKVETNNGILMMVSQGDRRVEVEIGHGITEVMSNRDVQNIVDTAIIPAFKHEKYEQGIISGAIALSQAVAPEIAVPASLAELALWDANVNSELPSAVAPAQGQSTPESPALWLTEQGIREAKQEEQRQQRRAEKREAERQARTSRAAEDRYYRQQRQVRLTRYLGWVVIGSAIALLWYSYFHWRFDQGHQQVRVVPLSDRPQINPLEQAINEHHRATLRSLSTITIVGSSSSGSSSSGDYSGGSDFGGGSSGGDGGGGDW
ncbi:MAG: TPM domain-containing protein [Merismopedia sp. SIO2A8]|nr:TPM domain-containing protein [Merismopedia sp. SIO2A8]